MDATDTFVSIGEAAILALAGLFDDAQMRTAPEPIGLRSRWPLSLSAMRKDGIAVLGDPASHRAVSRGRPARCPFGKFDQLGGQVIFLARRGRPKQRAYGKDYQRTRANE